MIVGSRFHGDLQFGAHVMFKQHEAYYHALNTIVRICQEYGQLAYIVVKGHSNHWEFVESFDHRSLQDAHDLLAAAWRFRHELKVRQMTLPGFGPCENPHCRWEIERGMKDPLSYCPAIDCPWQSQQFKEEPEVVGPWITWLENEVRSWRHHPYLIRGVMQILKNQDKPLGYQAEDELRSSLVSLYGDVPWIGLSYRWSWPRPTDSNARIRIR